MMVRMLHVPVVGMEGWKRRGCGRVVEKERF